MQKLWTLIFIILAASCTSTKNVSYTSYDFKSKDGVPDYSNLDYWAAHPWKKDPSDSLSKPLKKEQRDSVADVFFIHPTTYTETKKEWNADINDAALTAKTDYTSILYQAS